jgi:regulator of PEP synthase PpsR (kinase-PPPase family)
MDYIFVVSDGTGTTGEQTLKAALTQFAGAEVKIERRPGVRNKKQILQVVKEAAKVRGFIVQTLVSDEMRELIVRLSREYNIETIDLMGPLLARLSQQFVISPAEKPGIFRHLNEAYFRRIETMEFAFSHDDGLRFHELQKAEIVLLGVSRTFKTPLSIYLAFKGWFVANVAIVIDIEPPPILFELSPRRVICLTTNYRRLAELRRVRVKNLGAGEIMKYYSNPNFVRSELDYAMNIFNSQPKWTIIDVTNKPIEEIASEILALGRFKHNI